MLHAMSRIFRKARSDMTSTGRFSKYGRYAVGEIVLLVVGILIALQIDTWNDGRIDRQKEREYLASMLTDLRADIQGIDEAIRGNTILLGGLDELLMLLGNPRSDVAYPRDIFICSLVHTYWHMRVDFSELTMTQLKYSGDLQLIESGDVREAMLGYEKGIETCRHQYAELTNYFHVVEATQKKLLNYALAKQGFEYIEGDYLRMLEPPENFEPLVPAGEYFVTSDPALLANYYGDVLFYRTAMNNTVWFLGEQRKMAEDLIRLISSGQGIAE